MSLKQHRNQSWRQDLDRGIVMLDFEDFGFSLVFIGRPCNFYTLYNLTSNFEIS